MDDIVYKVTHNNESWGIGWCNNKYKLRYEVGKTVKCIPGTLGIFCFKTLKDLYDMLSHCISRDDIIYKVKGINRMETPKRISSGSEEAMDNFYSPNYSFSPYKTPHGTVCYEAVEVLERIN